MDFLRERNLLRRNCCADGLFSYLINKMKKYIILLAVSTFLSCKEEKKEVFVEPVREIVINKKEGVKDTEPTITETEEWILSKLSKYNEYDVFEVRGIPAAGIEYHATKRRFNEFSFLAGELLLSFTEESYSGDYKSIDGAYTATIHVPINSLERIEIVNIDNSGNCVIKFISPNKEIRWTNHTKKFTERTSIFSIKISCITEDDLENRLQKAFSYIKYKMHKNKPQKKEPF